MEDAGSSWGAVYLSGTLGTDAATAGLAFVALSVAMTVGRLTGDRVVDRFGQAHRGTRGRRRRCALGMGLALAVPTRGHHAGRLRPRRARRRHAHPRRDAAADELPGLPPGAGLTVVSWLLRIGFLLSPPLVGVVADAAGLRVGLLTVVLAGVGMVVLGGHLAPRRPSAHV